MEEYWLLAPMLRLAISSASFNFFFFSETLQNNLPVARVKQLARSIKKITSCKKAAAISGDSKILPLKVTRGVRNLRIYIAD